MKYSEFAKILAPKYTDFIRDAMKLFNPLVFPEAYTKNLKQVHDYVDTDLRSKYLTLCIAVGVDPDFS